MTMKKRIFWVALAGLGGAMLVYVWMFDATADGESYSVSLNSPVTFPVDICLFPLGLFLLGLFLLDLYLLIGIQGGNNAKSA